jgi:uncharacterized YceG family protein
VAIGESAPARQGSHVVFGKRSDQPRTADDRARAAADRAARRAGRPLPPEAFADSVRPPDVEPRDQRTAEYTPTFETGENPAAPPEEEPRDDAPRDDASPGFAAPDDEPPGLAAPEAADAAWQEPSPLSREVPDVAPSARRAAPRLVAARRLARDEAPEKTTDQASVDDDGSGSYDPEEPYEPPPTPPMRPAPPRPQSSRRRAAPPRPRRGRRPTGEGHWGRRIFAVVGLIVIVAALYAINGVFQPFHGDGSGAVQVVVPPGASTGQIADLLKRKGVIQNAAFFEVNATVTGNRGKLRPGRYVFAKDAKYSAVLGQLTTPPKARKAPPTTTVRFTEGPSLKEMAPLVDRSHKVTGDYAKAATAPGVLKRIHKLGAPKGTRTPEGFLFPATYTLTVGSSAKQLVAKQLAAFKQNFAHVSMGYAHSKHLTRYDVLIIASMIEREAELARERPLVAAVIYNRLKQGMPLGIDATIRYYTNNWQRPIRVSELQKDEPFNTRLNRGLPPTPIGNPGLASLKAAAHPAHKPYLFYVRKPGNSGAHAFSSTDAQFERDVAKYQKSRGQ